MHERSRDGEVAVDPREHLGGSRDGLRDREAVFEQAVAVGLVHTLGGWGDAVLRPRRGVLAEHGVQQRAHARVLDRRDQRAQTALELGHRHGRARA